MSWLAQAPNAASPIEGYFGLRPELLDRYRRFYGTLWDEELLDPGLLEMVRLRIAQIHGSRAEMAVRHRSTGLSPEKIDALAQWRGSDLFDDRDRVLLAYAEQIPFAHQMISDEDAAAVRDVLGDAGYVAFSVAVAMFDALCRVRLTMELAESGGDPMMPPATGDGVLR